MPRANDDVERTLHALSDLLPRFAPRRLETYITDLLEFNPQLGLISKQDSPEVAARLVRQSVALWEFATGHAAFAGTEMPWRVADIGTGGGFPGLVWKLLEHRIHLTLIERMERKAHFLERVVQRLGLVDTRVIARDVREIAHEEDVAETFHLVTMMAVATPGALGEALETLLRPGGFLATIRPTTQQLVEQRVGTNLTLVTRDDSGSASFVLYHKHKHR
jgi:16S rRNA (guanine527-N7)-methyltransferase